MEEAGRLPASADVASRARRPASLGPASLAAEQGADGGLGAVLGAGGRAAVTQTTVLGKPPED